MTDKFVHPTHPEHLPSLGEIEELTHGASPHFFDRDTLRFFGQRKSMFRIKRSPAGRIFVYAPSYWRNHDGPGVRLMGFTLREFTGTDLALPRGEAGEIAERDTLGGVRAWIAAH